MCFSTVTHTLAHIYTDNWWEQDTHHWWRTQAHIIPSFFFGKLNESFTFTHRLYVTRAVYRDAEDYCPFFITYYIYINLNCVCVSLTIETEKKKICTLFFFVVFLGKNRYISLLEWSDFGETNNIIIITWNFNQIFSHLNVSKPDRLWCCSE